MSIETIFTPVFTDAGRAAVAAADGQGLQATVAEIAFGDAQYAVRDVNGNPLTAAVQMTALSNELLRVPLSAGAAIADDQILLEALVAAGAPTFWIGEIGFFLADGTLLAVASHDTQTIGWRGDVADWVFRFVLGWTDMPAGSITVQFNGDAAHAALSSDFAQLENKVRDTVAAAGLTWADTDDSQLTAAIDAKVATVDLSGKLDHTGGTATDLTLSGATTYDTGHTSSGNSEHSGRMGFGMDPNVDNARVRIKSPDSSGSYTYGLYVEGPTDASAGSYKDGIRIIMPDQGTPTSGLRGLVVQCLGDSLISSNPVIHAENRGTQGSGLVVHASNASQSYPTLIVSRDTNATADAIQYKESTDIQFKVAQDGSVYSDTGTYGTGADYGEFFEWSDGNPSNEDRAGLSVVLEAGGTIRPATSTDAPADIIGVVSAMPTVVGDAAWNHWTGKYLRDDYGRVLTETATYYQWVAPMEHADTGELIKEGGTIGYFADEVPADVSVPDTAEVLSVPRKIHNPDHDPDQDYTPRQDRPEWSVVGMVGKLRLRKGQPTGERWIKMRDISAEVEEWLVR